MRRLGCRSDATLFPFGFSVEPVAAELLRVAGLDREPASRRAPAQAVVRLEGTQSRMMS